MALKGKLIKFIDSCTGFETARGYIDEETQLALFGVDYQIRPGETGIVLE